MKSTIAVRHRSRPSRPALADLAGIPDPSVRRLALVELNRLRDAQLADVYHPIGAQVVVSSSGQSLNYRQAVPLTFEQFRFGFANAVDESGAHELHEMFAAPGSGVPIFQAATANLNPRTEAWVDTETPTGGHCSSSRRNTTTPCRRR